MNAKEFIEKSKRLAEFIEKHPELILDMFEISKPASEADIQNALQTGIKDEQVLDFYKQANGIILRWQVEEDIALNKYGVEGLYLNQGYTFLPLDSVLGDWEDYTYFGEDDENKALHPFNIFNEDVCECFWLEEGKSYNKLDIYYYYSGEEKYKLPFDFAEYLDKLYESKGFWHWSSLFTPDKETDAETIAEQGLIKKIFSGLNS